MSKEDGEGLKDGQDSVAMYWEQRFQEEEVCVCTSTRRPQQEQEQHNVILNARPRFVPRSRSIGGMYSDGSLSPTSTHSGPPRAVVRTTSLKQRQRQQDAVNDSENLPGAFSVSGMGATDCDDTDVSIDQNSLASQVPVVAIATAVVVEESDIEHQRSTLAKKLLELKLQEERLAQQAAALTAWEQQLEQRRIQIESAQVTADPTIAPKRSRLMPNFLHSRPPSRLSMTALVTRAPSLDPADLSTLTIPLPSDHLTDGQLRFAPPMAYNLQQVLSRLSPNDHRAFRLLNQRWQNKLDKRIAKYGLQNKMTPNLPLQWHLRYLHFCAVPSKRDHSYSFSVEKAWAYEKKVKSRFLTLNVFQLNEQINSKTLFPVPGLKTSAGHDMFYMRPARYFPNKTSVKAIIDNLCYVMNTMLENNDFAQREGIGFVACMDHWKMKNFDVNYCFQFMMALQGFMVPVKTQLFLIVNPPSWFGRIWTIMKPMLSPSFRKRVKIVPEHKIAKYLAPDYQLYLPDDMQTGLADTHTMIQDFIAYRRFAEKDSAPHLDNQHDEMECNGSDAQSVAHSDTFPISYNPIFEDMQSFGRSSNSTVGSLHSSLGSGISLSTCSSIDDSDSDYDDASIHCDIHDNELLDDEDCKQAATPDSQSV